jgi:small subunit ribosomal protein S6
LDRGSITVRRNNTMRMYETIIIVQPDLGDVELKALSAKIQEVISTMKGEYQRLEDWGVRKLAYPINKVTRGRYYYLRFDGDAPLIAELERRLRLDDKVVRYQSVKIEKDTGAAAAAAKAAAEAEAAVETEAPVEAAESATESE